MKNFPMLDTILKLLVALTIGLLEKLMILLYCLLPMGLFMLLMSLRTKNHKATAIGTYTNERSEFQHIFPNYILVIVEPAFLRNGFNKKISAFNNFLHKYSGMILFGIFVLILFMLAVYYLCAYHII